MKTRPYQEEALSRLTAAFEREPSCLIVMATGLGKTVVFATLAARWQASRGRVLILAHREELITQARDKLAVHLGDDVAVEMAGSRSDEGALVRTRAVAASVQTLRQEKRLVRFRPRDFGLVIIDEAHHAVAGSYRRIIDYFRDGRRDDDGRVLIDGNPEVRLLGVTATPRRADDLALGQVFGHVAFSYEIEDAIADGWLVPVVQRAIKVEGLDFSAVRSTAGDLNERDLEEILATEEHLHKVAAPTIELAGDRGTLVFAVTVKHAELLAALLDRYKPGSALALSGKSDDAVRKQAVEDFRAGKVQFLVNCGLFLEGFDAPNTAVVVMARPTKSLPLYVQVLGRGTRPLPGVVDGPETAAERRAAIAASAKPSMMVLDFVGNSGKHKLVSAQDVLGGRYGQPIRDYARQTVETEGRAAPVEESLERARDELALLEEIRERDRRAAVKARAEYAAAEVSPFAGGLPTDGEEMPHDGPTEKQLWFLVRRCGWEVAKAKRLTKKQASAVIGKWHEAQRAAG